MYDWKQSNVALTIGPTAGRIGPTGYCRKEVFLNNFPKEDICVFASSVFLDYFCVLMVIINWKLHRTIEREPKSHEREIFREEMLENGFLKKHLS